ncbi:RepB family protein [Clostridium perfringens]|uniref:RepB family protein n=1 Tax=Clostridium perfringens TaxID=1502 RepID=UPI0013DDDE97|nr:RepB family protein [Clostridium perfringens]
MTKERANWYVTREQKDFVANECKRLGLTQSAWISMIIEKERAISLRTSYFNKVLDKK